MYAKVPAKQQCEDDAKKERDVMQTKCLAIAAASVVVALTTTVQPSEARLVKFIVQSQKPYLNGADWGNVGPYEILQGTAYFEVDPRDPRDSLIVDIEKAPRNAHQMVEFSTPFFILKPAVYQNWNHKLFYAVNNRGNSLEGLLTATTAAQVAGTDAGYAMTRGYAIVDAGWEADVVPTSTNLAASLPIAHQASGAPIIGPMRYEYYDRTSGTYTTNLEGTPGFTSYPTSNMNTAHATFTVSDSEGGPQTPIPPSDWAFGTCPTGKASLVPDPVDLCYFAGFDNTKLYTLIYQAENPIVMGLGFATTRDLASFLRYKNHDDFGNPNPLGAGVRRAYAAGGSQTGGYLRDYIYLGFNEDREGGSRVFDGIIPWIAGTDRVMINVRFADPNAYSEQDHQHNYLQDSYPPFTYAVTTDPISGITDGILKRPETDPLVMQIDSESESWQLHDSLNVIDGEGKPIGIPTNLRMYFVGNTAHGFISGSFLNPTPGTSTLCAYGTPGGGLNWETLRASLRNLDEWADRDLAPPPSNYPSLSNGTYVPLTEAAAAFPKIPQVAFPTVLDTYQLLIWNSLFGKLGGIMAFQPPQTGPTYVIMVPKTNNDGIQLAGVNQIESRVPLGTSTGWNVRTPEHRGPNLCSLTGSYFPFAITEAQRRADGDPRPSLEERYGTHARFVTAVQHAAQQLVNERFLLDVDAAADISAAKASNVLK
jgi:Alpha/beta hydrolase domain